MIQYHGFLDITLRMHDDFDSFYLKNNPTKITICARNKRSKTQLINSPGLDFSISPWKDRLGDHLERPYVLTLLSPMRKEFQGSMVKLASLFTQNVCGCAWKHALFALIWKLAWLYSKEQDLPSLLLLLGWFITMTKVGVFM